MKKFVFALLLVVSGIVANAQKRFSVITCGVGDEIYTLFGHAALRVFDTSTNQDIIYNWGTFNGFAPDFEIQFMRGKLPYYVSTEQYLGFLHSYKREGRYLKEWVLNLDSAAKQGIEDQLAWNMLPENKTYQYDFVYDNCATRIRDLLVNALNLVTPQSTDYSTYRRIINQYLVNNPWEKFGINILLGKSIDQKMGLYEASFIPELLGEWLLLQKTIDGAPLVKEQLDLLPQTYQAQIALNGILILNITILILSLILNLFFKKGHLLQKLFNGFMLMLTGLLGCLMLVMWFFTDHQACNYNYNFLWAMPLNLVLAFRQGNVSKGVKLFLIVCMALVILLQLLGIQSFPMLELAPLLLAMLLVYKSI